MANIGMRLKEERNRMLWNQTELAMKGGVQPQAQLRYERGDRKPDAAYLSDIARHGIDVLYVLTGARTAALLTVDEARLLQCYRGLEQRGRAGLLGLASGMMPEPKTTNGAAIFNGAVGQQIQGGAVFNDNVTIEMPREDGKKK